METRIVINVSLSTSHESVTAVVPVRRILAIYRMGTGGKGGYGGGAEHRNGGSVSIHVMLCGPRGALGRGSGSFPGAVKILRPLA